MLTRTLLAIVAGTLAVGALAGPAMAATDTSGDQSVRKAGGDPQEIIAVLRAGTERIIAI
jgi:hypothetical protein